MRLLFTRKREREVFGPSDCQRSMARACARDTGLEGEGASQRRERGTRSQTHLINIKTPRGHLQRSETEEGQDTFAQTRIPYLLYCDKWYTVMFPASRVESSQENLLSFCSHSSGTLLDPHCCVSTGTLPQRTCSSQHLLLPLPIHTRAYPHTTHTASQSSYDPPKFCTIWCVKIYWC